MSSGSRIHHTQAWVCIECALGFTRLVFLNDSKLIIIILKPNSRDHFRQVRADGYVILFTILKWVIKVVRRLHGILLF